MRTPAESALLVEVREAEPVVGRFRRRHDPSSAAGVPAHVTVIYPFLPPAKLSTSVLRTLKRLFAEVEPFRATFTRARRFPQALYLAPRPASRFRRLTELVFARFPQAPPYEGKFPDVVPHLTIAHATTSKELAKIARDFARVAARKLPVKTTVTAVLLFQRNAGRWRRRHAFSLEERS